MQRRLDTAADYITVLEEAIAAPPPAHRRRLMVTVDGAGASHDLVTRLGKLAAWRGYQVIYSVGWELGKREKAAITQVPEQAWQIAVDARGEVRERRADDACADRGCAHPRCWVQEAHVTELTGLLRHGPAGDQLVGWPAASGSEECATGHNSTRDLERRQLCHHHQLERRPQYRHLLLRTPAGHR